MILGEDYMENEYATITIDGRKLMKHTLKKPEAPDADKRRCLHQGPPGFLCKTVYGTRLTRAFRVICFAVVMVFSPS